MNQLTVSNLYHESPRVETHATIWYKNWLTCDICKTWVLTFKDIATLDDYTKALKGLLWMVCAT